MTVRELADVAGCSIRTVQRAIARLYPDRISQGSKADLTQWESVKIMMEIRKRGFVEPRQNDEVLRQNGEVPSRGKPITHLTSAVIRELRKLYSPPEARRRLDHLLGYHPPVQKPIQPRLALPLPPEVAEQGFRNIRRELRAIDERRKQIELFDHT